MVGNEDANDSDGGYVGVGAAGVRYCKRGGGAGGSALNQVKQMGKAVSGLHTIWVDGGFDRESVEALGDGLLPLDCTGSADRNNNNHATRVLKKRWVVERTLGCSLVSAIEQRLRAITTNLGDIHLSILGLWWGDWHKFDPPQLFKHPLKVHSKAAPVYSSSKNLLAEWVRKLVTNTCLTARATLLVFGYCNFYRFRKVNLQLPTCRVCSIYALSLSTYSSP